MSAAPEWNAGVSTSAMPNDAIVLKVGDNYQAIVNAAPEGATFWFEEGVHRLNGPIEPKDGQTFIGEQGAVLDGSREIEHFQQSGGLYVATGQTQEGERIATGEGADGADRPGFPETFFIDGDPLRPVDNLADVQTGTFYFDYQADRIYFADNPAAHLVEAGYSSAAFDSDATGVTIENLVIEQFNSPTQHGAIQGGESWTVLNNEVRLNYGVGITVGDGSVMAGNFVHDNGQMGIGGNGDNILVEGNEIAHNGYWSGIDQFWEGGGSKFAETENLIVRDNYSHDNHGFGLWTDINNINTLYEGNLVVNNDGGGITHEISYDAVIRDNTLIGNGHDAQGPWLWGGQIQIQNSQNVEIYGNQIDMSGDLNGISLIQQNRGSGTYGAYTTTGNTIHDNTLVSVEGDGHTGGVADYHESAMLNGGNAFFNNDYYMNDGDHWWWGDFASGDDWDAYLADSGQGSGSHLIETPPPNTDTWISAWDTRMGGEPGQPEVTDPGVSDPGSTDRVEFEVDPNHNYRVINGSAIGDDIDGSRRADLVYGLDGDDLLEGKGGNDVLFGGAGADQFHFDDGSGDDTIADFEADGANHDTVFLPDNFFDSISEILDAAHQVGSDVVIEYGNNQLTMYGIDLNDLGSQHFMIF